MHILKEKKKTLLIALIFCSGLMGFAYWYYVLPKKVTVMESPNGKHSVTIIQERDRLTWGREFYLQASSFDKTVVDKEFLVYSEWLEVGYDGYFPNHHWLTPDILWIGHYGERESGVVKITNSTNNRIEYLMLAFLDPYGRTKVIMFDFEPNSITTIKGEPNNFFWVHGRYVDGKEFKGTMTYAEENENRVAMEIVLDNYGVGFKPIFESKTSKND